MSIPYDLLNIIWNGETLRARPVSWNKDLTGKDVDVEEIEGVYITAYELTCPGCGCLCGFKVSDAEIICECGSKTNNPIYFLEEIASETAEEESKSEELEEEPKSEESEEEPKSEESKEESKSEESKEEFKSESLDVFDSLMDSISNTEIELIEESIELEEPESQEVNHAFDEEKAMKKATKKAKKKTTKKAKKKTTKKAKKKTTKK